MLGDFNIVLEDRDNIATFNGGCLQNYIGDKKDRINQSRYWENPR